MPRKSATTFITQQDAAQAARLHYVYAGSYSLERVVMPELRRLVQDTGESAASHVQWGTGVNAQRMSLLRVVSPWCRQRRG